MYVSANIKGAMVPDSECFRFYIPQIGLFNKIQK